MKKLMFAAVAAVAMAAVCEATIQSSNIVGFNGTPNNKANAPIIGGQFFDCAGSENFDLTTFSIPGEMEWEEVDDDEWEWTCTYISPKNEYLRVMDTSSLVNKERYTYISAQYLLDNLGDVCEEDWESTIEDYKWAIGWWKYDSTFDYKNAIKKNTPGDMKVVGALNFPNSTAFIGNFTKGKDRKLVSNGAVALQTFGFNNDGANAPVFGSQLPVDIDLTDMSIPGEMEWEEVDDDEWEWTCTYISPKNEYLRFMDTSSLANKERYTYISAQYLLDNLGDVCEEDWESTIEDFVWAVGWWKYDSTFDYKNAIKKNTPGDMMVKKGDVTISAGTGFIGNFTKGKHRQVNFPGATSVPSKQ